MNKHVIDLSNDDSPEQPRRRLGSVMDDGRSYGERRRGEAAVAPVPTIIDLASEPILPARTSDAKLSSRVCNPCSKSQSSPPHKRQRTRIEATSSRDGALITHNLLDLIDVFCNKNLLTINGNAPRSISNGHPKQPLHYNQKDTWSCGFRNLQMLISAMPKSFNTIFPEVPTLNEFQSSFELLWAEGFDPNGASHHNSKMVGKKGKISWIGAVEVWSYLSFRGIDATIVQFAKNAANRSCIGTFVWAYFSRLGLECACKAKTQSSSYECAQQLVQAAKQIRGSTEDSRSLITCNCTLLPLYLQWEGHSVTIVGIRRERCIISNGRPLIRHHLILFDPQKDGEMLRNKLAAESSKRPDQRQQNCLQFMELSTERLSNKDTQILLSSARSISDDERERCKERVSCVSVTV